MDGLGHLDLGDRLAPRSCCRRARRGAAGSSWASHIQSMAGGGPTSNHFLRTRLVIPNERTAQLLCHESCSFRPDRQQSMSLLLRQTAPVVVSWQPRQCSALAARLPCSGMRLKHSAMQPAAGRARCAEQARRSSHIVRLSPFELAWGTQIDQQVGEQGQAGASSSMRRCPPLQIQSLGPAAEPGRAAVCCQPVSLPGIPFLPHAVGQGASTHAFWLLLPAGGCWGVLRLRHGRATGSGDRTSTSCVTRMGRGNPPPATAMQQGRSRSSRQGSATAAATRHPWCPRCAGVCWGHHPGRHLCQDPLRHQPSERGLAARQRGVPAHHHQPVHRCDRCLLVAAPLALPAWALQASVRRRPGGWRLTPAHSGARSRCWLQSWDCGKPYVTQRPSRSSRQHPSSRKRGRRQPPRQTRPPSEAAAGAQGWQQAAIQLPG